MNRAALVEASIEAKAASDAAFQAATLARSADTKSIEADLDAIMARPIQIARSIIAKSQYSDILTDDARNCRALGFAAHNSRLCIYDGHLSYQTYVKPWGYGKSCWIDSKFFTGSDRDIAANIRAELAQYGKGHVPRRQRLDQQITRLKQQILLLELGVTDV